MIIDLNKFQGKFYELVLNKNISYSTLIDFKYSQSYKITNLHCLVEKSLV